MSETITDLVQLELYLLEAHDHGNATAVLADARRLDDLSDDADPDLARALVKRLNERLLALQYAYWRGAQPLPAELQSVMHRRATAVAARTPRRLTAPMDFDDPRRPAAITPAPRREVLLGGWPLSEGT